MCSRGLRGGGRPVSASARVLVVTALAAGGLGGGSVAAQDLSVFSALDLQGSVATDGTPVRGTLGSQDLIATGGRRIQVWGLDASDGEQLQVDLRSGDFDAYVYVVGPGLGEGLSDDDGGDGLNARVCVVVDEPGEYRIVAASLSSATGDYALEVNPREGVSDGACPEGEDEASVEAADIDDLPTDGRALRAGAEVEGLLSSSDPTLYGSLAQAWAVEGRAGESFSVDLVSDVFDAYLLVAGPGLEADLSDDDGAGRCDSRVTLTFPESGLYRVVASTLSASEGGPYRLITSEQPGPASDQACSPPSTTAAASLDIEDVAVVGSLAWEETREGSLTGSEGQYDGKMMQAWTLEGDAGARIAIEMRSSDFDSYLYLTGPGFEDPASNDDGAGNLNARLCAEFPEDGEYRVLSGPYSGGESGQRYTIRASRNDAAASCEEFEMSPDAIAGVLAQLPTGGRVLALGGEGEGTLDPAVDARHPDTNHLIQAWSFRGEAGRTVYVDVLSDEFDTVLYGLGAGIDGVLFIDDGAEGCNSRMSITPSESGSILLLPGAYSQEASGTFRLRASEDPLPMEDNGCDFSDADAPAGVAAADALAGVSTGEARPVEPITVASGSLGSEDEHLAGGQPAQAWTLPVQAGEEIEITLVSEAFDPMLYVDGLSIAPPLMDDDGAGELDSRITYTPTEDGVLRLVVSAYAADAAGDFELRIVRRVPVPATR